MRWIDLTPRDLRKLAEETDTCVIPIGSLERHGEHLPLGCDGVTAETVAYLASMKEKCVVFPTWYYGQVHEAACHTGSVNFSGDLLITVLRELCEQICENGFHKIVFFNGHGGNTEMLRYFARITSDEHRDYVIYNVFCPDVNEAEWQKVTGLMDTPMGGHADEWETSFYMGCRPGYVKLEYVDREKEPFLPMKQTGQLTEEKIWTSFDWYANYPENVTGTPSAATEEKGKKLLEIYVESFARKLALIKADESLPALLKEFTDRLDRKAETPEKWYHKNP